MHTFLQFTVIGITFAGIYAISACGLVLTYTASGIFNFAHGAVGMMAAYTYWQFNTGWGWGALPSLLIVVLVVAPLFGTLIERVIMRGLEGTSEVVKIVVTVSLMLALIGLANVIWPSLRSNEEFFTGHSVGLADVNVPIHQVIILGLAAVVAIGLRLFLYRTRLGVSMRAVVDDRALLQLNGGRPSRSASIAWAMGSMLAAVAGILASPNVLVGLSQINLSLLVVSALAAAVIGRLKSLPWAFAGGLFIGLAEAYVGHYVSGSTTVFGFTLAGTLSFAISPIILFVVLVALPHERLRAGGQARIRERWRVPTVKAAAFGGVVLVVVTAAIVDLVAQDSLLNPVVPGLYLALLMLSLVPLIGWAGQISLAQLSFAGIGALVMAGVGAGKTPAGVIVAVVVCAVVGAVVALPALRLSGIYLALATVSFGEFMDKMVFSQNKLFPTGSKLVPPLDLGVFKVKSNASEIIMLAVVFALLGVGLIALRRSSFGRRLTGMKDSPVACATLGLDLTVTKIVVFALSAAIAGLAGALFTGNVSGASSFTLTQSLAVTMMAVVGGVGAIGGVLIGGLLLGSLQTLAVQVFATNAVGLFSFFELQVGSLLQFTPGFIGIGLGRNPSGAISDIGDAYRQVGESRPALGCSVAGPVILWVLARSHTITNWTFMATIIVFVLAVMPLLPVLFNPIPGGRAALTGLWLAAVMVTVGALNWDTLTTSNGMRVLLMVLAAVVAAGLAFPIHGAIPPRTEPGPSPDMLGIDRPLTAADVLEADVALGIHEVVFDGAA